MTERTVVLGELASLYNVELDHGQIRLWAELLGPYGDQEIHAAARQWMRTSRWMPKPAELIELIKQARDAACGAPRYDREADEKLKATSPFRRPEGKTIIEHINDLRKAGKTPDEIADLICGPDDGRGPRYRCLTCEDSGYVQVWRVEAMRAAKRDTKVPWLVCVAACTCQAGQSRRDIPAYDPDRMLRVQGATTEEAIEQLKDFVENSWRKHMDQDLAQFSER